VSTSGSSQARYEFLSLVREQKDTTQKNYSAISPTPRQAPDWLRKGILKELVIEAGNRRTAKISFKSYKQDGRNAQGAYPFDRSHQGSGGVLRPRRSGNPALHLLTMTAIKSMTWVYNTSTSTLDPTSSQHAGWDDKPMLSEARDQMGRGYPQA